MLSCDYNGWSDVAEDEREWIVDDLETPSELTGDPDLQFTSIENTSRPAPDWST